MTFVSLHDEPRNVPGLDHGRLQDILIVQVKALHTMEQVDCFHLPLLLVQGLIIGVLGRPVLKLEHLTIIEHANHSLPVLLSEGVGRIIDLKSHHLLPNLLVEGLFVLVLLLLRKLHVIWRNVDAVSKELN